MPRLNGICIRRIHRQHTSAIVVLPWEVRKVMDAGVGDYVLFATHSTNRVVEISKLIPGGLSVGNGKKHSGRKNKGGRPRIKARRRR